MFGMDGSMCLLPMFKIVGEILENNTKIFKISDVICIVLYLIYAITYFKRQG